MIFCVFITNAALLVGGYYCFKGDMMVITNQVDLIIATKSVKGKVDRTVQDYIESIEYLSELFSKESSWTSSLDEDQKVDMLELKEYLRIQEASDVNTVLNKIRKIYLPLNNTLSRSLKRLEDTLYTMDIEAMRKLQEVIDKEKISLLSKIPFLRVALISSESNDFYKETYDTLLKVLSS